MGIAPFVRVSPESGVVGDTIQVYGQGFTQKGTKVTLSGVKANTTFVTPNYVKFVVPSGATSGSVKVKTPAGTLKSIDTFRGVPLTVTAWKEVHGNGSPAGLWSVKLISLSAAF
ncbi:MAG: IPT/TIG domain-containing protein [Rhizomicrobium sp.]